MPHHGRARATGIYSIWWRLVCADGGGFRHAAKRCPQAGLHPATRTRGVRPIGLCRNLSSGRQRHSDLARVWSWEIMASLAPLWHKTSCAGRGVCRESNAFFARFARAPAKTGEGSAAGCKLEGGPHAWHEDQPPAGFLEADENRAELLHREGCAAPAALVALAVFNHETRAISSFGGTVDDSIWQGRAARCCRTTTFWPAPSMMRSSSLRASSAIIVLKAEQPPGLPLRAQTGLPSALRARFRQAVKGAPG